MRHSGSFVPLSVAWRIQNAKDRVSRLCAGTWFLSIQLVLSSLMIFPQPAVADGLGHQHLSSDTVQDSSYTFPVTGVGQTSGLCTSVCYCSDHNNCTCDQSGTVQLNHDLSAPFSAFNYRVQPANVAEDCFAGTAVNLPAFVDSGQRLSFNVEFSPTSPGTFSDNLNLSGYILSVSGSTPSGGASLVPSPLTGWSAPLVVSTTPGTQTDSPNLRTTDPLYLSWSIQNQGDLSTFGTFFIDVDLDGSLLNRWSWSDPLQPQWYLDLKDYPFGPLAAGTHTLELIPDPTNVIGASSSTYTKTITVAGAIPAPPTMTTSWYVDATGKTQAALSVWANRVGLQAGQLNESKGDAGLVILDFGQPWVSKGVYGATGFPRHFTFISLAEIEVVMKHFVLGYELGTARSLFVGVGTNNYGKYVTAAHGRAWADMLVNLNAWSAGHGFAVSFFAANDVELESLPSPQPTVSWFDGFVNEVAASGAKVYSVNFGDASGCPQTTATSTPGPCLTGWTQADIANLPALQIPEIYNPGTAVEWANINLYNDLAHGLTGSLIKAPLSQSQACKTHPCPGAGNTAAMAWRQIARALNSSPATAPGVGGMQWSTDINYNQ
jgi:hypothetical protein